MAEATQCPSSGARCSWLVAGFRKRTRDACLRGSRSHALSAGLVPQACARPAGHHGRLHSFLRNWVSRVQTPEGSGFDLMRGGWGGGCLAGLAVGTRLQDLAVIARFLREID